MTDLQKEIDKLRERGLKHIDTAKNYPHINAARSAQKIGKNVLNASEILQNLYKELHDN